MVTEKNIVNFSNFDILFVSSIFVQCSRPIYKYLYKYIYSYKESILLVQFCVGSPKKDQTENANLVLQFINYK